MAAHSPATTASVLAEVDVAPRHLAVQRVADRRGQVGRVEVDVARRRRARPCRPGHRRACRPDRSGTAPSPCSATERRSPRRRAPTGDVLVGRQLPLRLAADGRLVVQRAGDARVRGPAPADVERAVEDRRLELRRASGVDLPPRRRRARPTRSTETTGPTPASAASTAASVRRLRAVGADHAVGRPGRRAVGPAASAGCPGAGPPQDGLVAGPGQRDVEQAQVLAPLLLELQLLVVGEVVALAPDVDGAPVGVGRVVEHRHVDCGRAGRPRCTGRARSGTRGPCCGGW